MSFGFRKNLNTTPKKLKKLLKGETSKKKQDKCNNICSDAPETDTTDSVFVGGGVYTTSDVPGNHRTDTVIDTNNPTGTLQKDDNGNAGKCNRILISSYSDG